MTRKRNQKHTQVVEGTVIPATHHSPRLANVKDCRREMAAVYREARIGLIDTKDATRLVYMLGTIVATIRDNELEQRIERLEEAHEAEFKKSHPTT
ncbi:MAG: hypothetical protein K2Y09_11190 [Nitrosomonas sp.]|uniref:hypothetical protein n=1 Tax=Nitrosomonas sp. TaxID=42353 RepID=UPI001D56E7BD|nr:hypothetical protein [Nitrosomonas sp.]MBX9895723.1 hypothetical protein [Nitrosomonas sp.]